jgi:RNA polymerase sigma-70 factor (ECF subfamily)
LLSTSSDLIQGVRRHDQAAWKRLVRVYSGLVYYWCRREARLSPDDADDVLQAVFMAVARSIGDLQQGNGGGSFRGWLRAITTNKIRDHLRRELQQPQAEGGSDAARKLSQVPEPFPESPDTAAATSPHDAVCEQSILINRLLEELRPQFDAKSWTAFWQSEIRGRPRQEIADELQMSPAAVNQAIYRIRKRLRQELGGSEE